MISNIAVLCNAFVIAFTSDFIPKMYYRMTQGTLHGYVDETLSYFDSTGLEFENSGYPKQIYCRYWDLRRPPCSLLENYNFTKFNIACADNYEFTDSWWIILAFRLAFVLVFELIVLTIKAMFAYIIPDMPTEIIKQLRRERYLMRQAVLQRRDSLELDNTTNETNSDSDILGDFDDEEEENNLNEQINNKNNLPKTNFQREAKEFDAMKRLFSKKRIPSMSTKQQNKWNIWKILTM
uniref:Anoctamin n=1 Tax=Meloidogyne hapla TaxID=6305 RepID=A0A1I8BAV7_MELHA